jgi:hypothetical protein
VKRVRRVKPRIRQGDEVRNLKTQRYENMEMGVEGKKGDKRKEGREEKEHGEREK